ncbi:hypothetical protein [Streptomyces sp. NBC_01789]|uniref:hypothetical protein n=1 Tax=Streptomyces sp. NBC_01789 TaxID=2975941 RepID=UPI00225AB2C4|nr:hypothetical protein [Streptomyces sp. NBC_01789]MCX4445044.1 hypothetical protein [Streptomyces sp. NBC_01789]
MRPRIGDDVLFAPVPGGVALMGTAGELTLKGAHVAALVERLAPQLDGRRTVEELTASLPAGHRTVVTELIGVLGERGLVHDAHRPARDGARFSGGTALVIGAGTVADACVRALAHSDVSEVIATAPGAEVPEGTGFALHLFGHGELSGARRTAADCAARGIPLVQVLIGGSCALIAPRDGVDWGAVWQRMLPAERRGFQVASEPAATDAACRVLASHLVFRLFRLVEAGAAGEAHGDTRLGSFDLDTLELTRHTVLPTPPPAWAGGPRSPAEFEDAVRVLREEPRCGEEEFSTRVVTAVDARFGVVLSLGEDDLPQVPLRRTRAVVADPASPGRTVTVSAWGADFATARHRTAMLALGVHRSLSFDAPWAWGLRLRDGAPCRVDAPALESAPVGVGLDWPEMVTDALLARCRQELITGAGAAPGAGVAPGTAPGPLAGVPIPAPGRDGDRVAAHRLRLLAVLGLDVRLLDVTAAAGAPAVAAVVDGAVHQLVCRPRRADAVRDVLAELLVAVQSGQEPVALLAGIGTAEAPARAVGGEDVVAGAVTALRRSGREPVLVPLDHDPALGRILPCVGKVVLVDA